MLVIGGQGSGKTTALQSLICAAAMTHAPEQVQFYCLALSSAALGTVAELLELLRTRMRTFPACGVTSVEEFRHRKFFGAPGEVPDDPYGDVFLVIDDYAALTDESSTLRGKEQLAAQINKIITDGRSFGIHTIASVTKNSNLNPTVRESWPQRIELRMASEADSRSGLRARELAKVPAGRPGRGMIMQDYPRQGVEPVGLHTLMARPALRDTDESDFDSASVVAAVARLAGRWRPAPPVRRLPARIDLEDIRSLAAQRRRSGIMWAVDEFAEPVTLDGGESPFMVITGRARAGRTTAAAALMSEIARSYAPGTSRAGARPGDTRPPAQVWLITPNRQLLKVLPETYVERFAYRADDVKALAGELAELLARRLPEKGLSMPRV